MGVFRELPVIAAPAQRLATVLAGRSCELSLRYNGWTDRWSFDLAIGGVMRLEGRRIVTGVDLIAAFEFGIGKLVAVDWEGKGALPGRTELPAGRIRLLHYDETAP
jgi:hypothetical protein